jgi:hypothetical protein
MANLNKVKIFPSIGIARVGNSPQWYLGPELPFPAPPPPPPGGTFKDPQCRIKRQAQRFRLWGFFDDSTDRELTVADGVIKWTVHVANSKTSLSGEGIIDPGIRTLNGPNDDATFATGTFLGVEVPLGEAHTDSDGRLIVVGGFGKSATPNNSPLVFPNSPGWYDDVADGPITAQISVNGSDFVAEGGAWVISAPPRYSPTTNSITSLYDTIRQVALDNGSLTLPAQPSFRDDIYPILKRALDMRFVTAFAFGVGDHDSLSLLIPPAPGQMAVRQAVFNKLKPAGNMPLLYGSSQIKPFQSTFMQQWSLEQSANDWPPVVPATITPDGLTRAALENCVGAAFFPGIEATSNVTSVSYTEPFRLDQTTFTAGRDVEGNVAALAERLLPLRRSDIGGPVVVVAGGKANRYLPRHRPWDQETVDARHHHLGPGHGRQLVSARLHCGYGAGKTRGDRAHRRLQGLLHRHRPQRNRHGTGAGTHHGQRVDRRRLLCDCRGLQTGRSEHYDLHAERVAIGAMGGVDRPGAGAGGDDHPRTQHASGEQ